MDKAYYQKLVKREKEKTITPDEAQELQEWIANDPQLNSWWEEQYNESSAEIEPALSNKLFAQIKERIDQTDASTNINNEPKATSYKGKTLKPLQWVAAVLLPIAIVFSIYQWLEMPTYKTAPFVVSAKKGDRATIELPDGTVAQLNSDSRLTYMHPTKKGERRAKITGEAYFQVAHDKESPFIVEVGELEVRVLGTSFTVSSYEEQEDIIVVLVEGKVEVTASSTSCTLIPGDKMCYNKLTQAMTTQQVKTSDYLAWTKGELYFENESMESLIRTLSRMYDVEVSFDNSSKSLRQERFTGTIPIGGIEKTLRILMYTTPFTYTWNQGAIVLREQ